MSTEKFRAPRNSRARAPSPPFIGALLRMALQRVRGRMFRALHAGGFTDLQDAHLVMITYPAPDGARPSDLARRVGISRQAANHLLHQVEAMGYLERRAAGDGARRLVYTTPRGWRATETIWSCLAEVEAELAAEIGEDRFAAFMAVLREVAQRDLLAFAPHPARTRTETRDAPGQSVARGLSSRPKRKG